MTEKFCIDHDRPCHVENTPRVPPNHPSAIRFSTEYSVVHFTAAEALIAAAKLIEAAGRARLPTQSSLLPEED
jgi:hypothetical protein